VSGYDDLPPVPANVPRSELSGAGALLPRHYNGQPVRIAALLQPVYDDTMRGIALIQVGETLDARRGADAKDPVRHHALAGRHAAGVALLVWFAVRLVLHPLMRLKHEVETRSLSDLSDSIRRWCTRKCVRWWRP
jgi:two-component system sensor histidine kinase TctE